MASRVYWKGLILVAKALQLYISRNQVNLSKNLTAPQMVCVNALLAAVVECLEVLPVNDPVE